MCGKGKILAPHSSFTHWHWHGFSAAVHHENHNTSETERMVNCASASRFSCLTHQLCAPSIQSHARSDSSCQSIILAGPSPSSGSRSIPLPGHLLVNHHPRAGKGNAHTVEGRRTRKLDGIRKTPPASRFSLWHEGVS